MPARSASWSILAVAGVLAYLVACSSTVHADVYGQDIVPGSHFHHGSWNFYGSDQVPTSTTMHDDFRTTYGWDRIPDMTHPHVEQHYNVLLIESVQRLTSAVEDTPPSRARPRFNRFRRR